MKKVLRSVLVFVLGMYFPVMAATYTVTTTTDGGAGSLRQAIIDANDNTGADDIVFNIPASDPNYNAITGVCTITLTDDLPEITDAVTIDGLTQPGASAGNLMAGTPHTLKIEIQGADTFGNIWDGFHVTAGNITIKGLAINRTNQYCISFIGSENNTVQTCHIGLDAAGLWADNSTNYGNGIYLEACGTTLIGGGGNENGNVIAGTYQEAILADDDGTPSNGCQNLTIQGNIIGWNCTGQGGNEDFACNRAIDLNNTSQVLIGGSTLQERNVIANCGDNLLFENCTTAVVMGNIIGTGINGNEPGYLIYSYTTLPSNQKGISIDYDCSGFQIENNLITGNYYNQIYAYSGTQITISGNKIGTDLTGMAVMSLPDIPPYFYNSPDNGIEFWEGVSNSTIGPDNIISGMAGGAGIRIYGSHDCMIIGNKIGTDLSGNPVLGNSEGGIAIESGNYGESPNNNVIGGRTSGEGNLIAGNMEAGISLSSGENNLIAGNSIFDNQGLGISLGYPRSVNDPNDTDNGPNRLQNFPVITGVTHTGSNTDITATLNSTPSASFTIDFYWSPNIYFNEDDYNSYGQGKVYLGSTSVTADGSGNAGPFTFAASGLIPVGWYVTATATDASNNTSEFSDYYMFGAAENIHVVTNCYDDESNTIPGSLRQAILDANAHPGPDYIHFNIPASDPDYVASGDYWSIQPWTDLPQIIDDVVIDGYTQPGAQANTTCMPAATDAVLKIEVSGINGGSGYGFYCNHPNLDVTIKGLAINQWGYAGINLVQCASANIEGNYIGTDITGMLSPGGQGDGIKINPDNLVTVGGGTPEKRNVISGNDENGIYMDWGASSCTIQGNYIGTDKSGAAALGNGDNGIYLYGDNDFNLIGGTTACSRNIISGNGTPGGDESCGIFGEYGDYNDNTIIGNYIGTGATGTEILGNAHNGIFIKNEINNNTIGGTAAGEGNVITHNGWAGINLREENPNNVSICNRISGNSIYDNGMLGIDLDGDTDNNEEPDGVTINDANDIDAGVNNYQNFPVLTSVLSDATTSTTISGSIHTTASSEVIVEFFSNTAADPSGYGEGAHYLGTATVTTDADGVADFSVTLPVGLPEGTFITTTATLKNGTCFSTSEFSSGALTSVIAPQAPDVTPIITALPNIMHSFTEFYVTVRVTELNIASTSGWITVRIPKDARWILDGEYDPTLTQLGTTALNNADWAYSQDDTHHIFSTSEVITAGMFSCFGFNIEWDAGATKGVYTITSQIDSWSGGENRIDNNVDSERLDYFIY